MPYNSQRKKLSELQGECEEKCAKNPFWTVVQLLQSSSLQLFQKILKQSQRPITQSGADSQEYEDQNVTWRVNTMQYPPIASPHIVLHSRKEPARPITGANAFNIFFTVDYLLFRNHFSRRKTRISYSVLVQIRTFLVQFFCMIEDEFEMI